MATRKSSVRSPRPPSPPALPAEFMYRGMRFRLDPEAGMAVSTAYAAIDAAVGVGADIGCLVLVVRSDPRKP